MFTFYFWKVCQYLDHPVQYNTISYIVVQNNTVQYSIVQNSKVQYSAVKYIIVQYNTIKLGNVEIPEEWYYIFYIQGIFRTGQYTQWDDVTRSADYYM